MGTNKEIWNEALICLLIAIVLIAYLIQSC